MLNADLKQQLKQLLELMEGNVEFVASLGSDDKSKELKDLLTEITDMSPRLSLSEKSLKTYTKFLSQSSWRRNRCNICRYSIRSRV